MKAAQKKPIKIDLSRSLCKQVFGASVLSGGGPRNQKVESTEQKSDG